jgi:two-component sensor histidine kinase
VTPTADAGHPRKKSNERPRRVTQAAATSFIALLLVLFVLGAGWLLYQSYRETYEGVRLTAEAHSKVVAANVEWVTATARQVLLRIDNSLGQDLATLPASEISSLRAAVDALPGGALIYVVRADGTTVLTTDDQFRNVDIRDREYFKAPAEGAEWYTSALLVSRLNGEQIFAISRRLERDGRFAGVAVLSFGLELMQKVWASLNIDDQSTVSLFRDDGQLVLRYPPAEGPLDLSDYVLFTDLLPQAASGTYDAISPADGTSRLVGYRRVPDTNLLALASHSTEAGFRQFTSGALTTTVILVPVALALGLLGLWTTRLLRRDALREVELTDALERNQMLLREVHHRVKNNLQSVVSLLRMQKLPAEVERDTIARIHSMSALHQHIYETDQFGDVEAAAFVRVIVDDAVSVYGSAAKVSYQLESFVIERDQAVGLGLVVTEVVSNACKYGADSNDLVTLEVALLKKSDREAVLTIKDNGKGFDPNSVGKGMGSRLVEVFAASLGSFGYSNDNGSGFSLTIERR